MSGPWEKYQQDGPWTKYATQPAPEPPSLDPPAEPQRRSAWDEAKRQTGLVGRYVAEGVASLPLAAMDAGVATRNLVTGSKYDMPSQMFQEGLDAAGFPRPEGMLEKGTGLLWSGVAGAKAVPNPTIKAPAPEAFAGPQSTQAATLAAANKQGYAVPPMTSNPTATNRFLEGTAGKITTAQLASAKNQAVTDKLAKQALGLSPNAPLTQTAIKAVREEAYGAYRAIRGAGALSADDAFRTEVGAAVADAQNLAGKLPSLAENKLLQQADELVNAEGLDADTAVAAIRAFRDLADEAYRAGKGGVGASYKRLAKSLEDLIERNLAAQGDDGAKLLADYRSARELIAKSHTVEDAFNPATGHVSATKIARELSNDAPLSGPLKEVGRFGQAFPKAAREFNESLPGFSPLDMYATAGVAGFSGDPAYLALPFTRQALRHGLLTPWAQKYLATPTAGNAAFGPAASRAGALGLLSGFQ